MILLETYTTLSREEFRDKWVSMLCCSDLSPYFLSACIKLFIIFVFCRLPKFLAVDQEVTGDSAFSMFNLSLREEWLNNKRYLLSNMLIIT